jgi:hypothetical protein
MVEWLIRKAIDMKLIYYKVEPNLDKKGIYRLFKVDDKRVSYFAVTEYYDGRWTCPLPGWEKALAEGQTVDNHDDFLVAKARVDAAIYNN